jgi:hypothetical protein
MWKQQKLEAQIETVRSVKDLVVVSGGLAWHLISPEHEEIKKMHDHSDVDLFVSPGDYASVVTTLRGRGFNRYWTKYDGITPRFYRYGSSVQHGGKQVKVLLDIFLEDVPSIEVGEFRVVKPAHLLTYYGRTHASARCWAVHQARILVARGIDPVGREELIQEPAE